jgi:cytochrome c peroxidase
MKGLKACLWGVAVMVSACQLDNSKPVFELPEVTFGFPVPDSIRLMSETAKAQVLLGRKLFHDPQLSASGNFSCASCHLPQLAFAGGIDRNVGENSGRGRRNTPALFNLWWQSHFFADGGIPRLAEVALAPMDNVHELNLPIDTLVRKLRKIPVYQQAFQEVYGREPDPFTVTRALMWFQLSLISAASPFDRWYFDHDKTALSASAQRGYALFVSERAQCSSCHTLPFFTDGQFYSTGYQNNHEPDTGRARISMSPADLGKFKTPSLRNLAFTAPYMHDGGMATLEEVLHYYNRGGDNEPNKDERIKPIGLSTTELTDLKNFLLSLSDTAFTRHRYYRPAGYLD